MGNSMKVLVTGFTQNYGGVEAFVMNYYREMKKIAESEKTDIYLYSNIAEKSLERMKNV